jgi:hypothetical protein
MRRKQNKCRRGKDKKIERERKKGQQSLQMSLNNLPELAPQAQDIYYFIVTTAAPP